MAILFDKINILLIITACLNLFLGIVIFLNGRKKKINVIYSFNIIAIIGWVVSMILYRLAPAETSLFWCTILYITPTFIASSFLYFTYIFPSEKDKNILPKSSLIFFINAVIVFMIAWPELIIKEVNIRPGIEKEIIFTKYYWFYFLYTFSFFTYGFSRLFKKFLRGVGIEKLQVLYLLIGYAIAANLAFATNLIMPWIGLFFLNWLGQVFTIVMVGFTAYAILKKELFGIRLVLTSLFVGVITTLLFIDILAFTSDLSLQILKGAILVLFLYFGYLLIKSVLKEIKYREQIQKAYESLKVLDKAKSEFISMASHQLRTPLSAIKGYISMLIEGSYGQIPDKAREKLKNVFQSNERLVRVVNDLLDISRIEMGKMEVEKAPTQIEDLIRSCYEEMKIGAEKKGLKFVFKKTKTTLPKIEIDSLKIRQVFLNLIDNAIRYTREGEIEIEVKKADSSIRVSVRDTGEGLTPAEQRDIFEGFARGSAGLTYFIEGAGLGLYVAKKFLELHKGKIWMESEGKGKGSTFFVELPIK